MKTEKQKLRRPTNFGYREIFMNNPANSSKQKLYCGIHGVDASGNGLTPNIELERDTEKETVT